MRSRISSDNLGALAVIRERRRLLGSCPGGGRRNGHRSPPGIPHHVICLLAGAASRTSVAATAWRRPDSRAKAGATPGAPARTYRPHHSRRRRSQPYMLGFAKMMIMPRGQAGQDVFHAIADGNRRVLIDLMEPGPRAVGELVLASGMSYSATSQHLAILRRAGLVSSEASGRRRIYRLRPAGLREVYDWSGRYREFWRGRLDALGDLLGEQS